MSLARTLLAAVAVGFGVAGVVLWRVTGSRQAAWNRRARWTGIVAAFVVAAGARMPPMVAGPQANSAKEKSNVVAKLEYLDHLRSCTPYTYSIPEPLARSIAESTVRGKDGDACKVSSHVPNSYFGECAFSEAAIRALTSQAKYRKARTGKLNASLTDAEGKGRQ